MTVQQQLTLNIRQKITLNVPISINKLLKMGASYHTYTPNYIIDSSCRYISTAPVKEIN